MPRSKIIDVDEILENFDKAIQETGQQVAKEIEIAFDLAVDDFYSKYEPRSYDRTESTLKASSSNNGKPSYKKLGMYSCDAGIIVDSKYMGEPYHKKHGWNPSADFIFNRTWNMGIHGFTDSEVATKKKYNRFMGYYSDMVWIPMAKQTYMTKTHKFLSGYHAFDSLGNYSRSYRNKYRPDRERIMAPPKSTPPQILMNTRFNAIKSELSSVFEGNFNF